MLRCKNYLHLFYIIISVSKGTQHPSFLLLYLIESLTVNPIVMDRSNKKHWGDCEPMDCHWTYHTL